MKHLSSLPLKSQWTAFHKDFSSSLHYESVAGKETFVFDLPMDTRQLMFLHGKCPDPRIGDLSTQSDWVATREWWFINHFEGAALEEGQKAFIRIRGMDQLAEIFVNGIHLGSSESFNQVHYFDATTAWKSGTNELSIRLWTCDPTDIQSTDEAAKNQLGGDAANMNMGMAGLFKATTQSLKSRMLYGGDQNPFMLSCGLAIAPEVIIARYVLPEFIRSEYEYHADNYHVSGLFLIQAQAWGASDYELTIRPKNFEWESFTLRGKWTEPSSFLTIPFSHLPLKPWTVFDLGFPHCYELILKTGGQTLTVTTGFRKYERRLNTAFKSSPPASAFDWNGYENQSYGQDYYKGYETVEEGGDKAWPEVPREYGTYHFDHYLNGQKYFAKGGSVVPTNLFWSDWDGEHLRRVVRRARESNNNTLRVWGGGYLSGDEFFEEADLQGVSISQDFLNFSGGTDKSLFHQKRLENEFRNVISQLNIHPSVVVLNGGNELYQFGTINRPTDPIFQMMERVMRQMGQNQYFHRSSPINPELHGPWHFDLDHASRYNSCRAIFNSECGITGSASLKSLKRFLPHDQLHDIYGSVWHHRMPDRGYFAIFESYPDLFIERKHLSVEDFVRYTQCIQAWGYQYVAEEYRRQKPVKSGFTTWEFNEPWTDFNWGIIDSELIPKHSFYTFARGCAPALVSARFNSYVWAAESKFHAGIWFSLEGGQHRHATVRTSACDDHGNILFEGSYEGWSGGDSIPLGDVSFKVPANGAFFLKLQAHLDNGQTLDNDYAFTVIPKCDAAPLNILFLSGKVYERHIINEYFKAAQFVLDERIISPQQPLNPDEINLQKYDAVVLAPVFNPLQSLGDGFFDKLKKAIHDDGLGFVYFPFNSSAYVSGRFDVDPLCGSVLEELLPFSFAPNHYSNSDEHSAQWKILDDPSAQSTAAPWEPRNDGLNKVRDHLIWNFINTDIQLPILSIRVQTAYKNSDDIIGIEGRQPVLGVKQSGKGRIVAFAGPFGGHNFSQTPFRRWIDAEQLLINLVEYAASGNVSRKVGGHTPLAALAHLPPSKAEIAAKELERTPEKISWHISVRNTSPIPLVYFTIENTSPQEGQVFDWHVSDNYLLLMPGESKEVHACVTARNNHPLPEHIDLATSAWNLQARALKVT
ncbi:MAG: hypothetical protein SGI98_03085 [Verrucomicrobiota bacterium]|nr:hypothetical protein [Verrucomicrobiota bacterium]